MSATNKGLSEKLSAFSLSHFGAILFLGTIAFTGYYPQQGDFTFIIAGFTTAFGLYYFFCKKLISSENLYFWLTIAVVARLILLFSFPNLSDDIYRFIWDGYLINHGINPFDYLPTHYLAEGTDIPGITPALFKELNSPEYFTIYPPVCQAIFAFGTWLFPSDWWASAVTMKVFFLVFEIATIFFGIKLLRHFKMDETRICWYALNPLIIVELMGNVHFEALMVSFLAASLWFYTQRRLHFSAVAMGLAICTKLLPLMFLPFFIRRLGIKKALVYFTIVGATLVVLFGPLLNGVFFGNIGSSINLYFQRFEFNGGIYYFLRWLGMQISGYNQIRFIGPGLAFIVFIGICYRAFTDRDLSDQQLFFQQLFALSLFLFCTTTVMPWYLTGIIFLTIFTRFRYAFVWSYLVLWTYINYSYGAYFENLWVVGMEYVLVFCFLLFEVKKLNRGSSFDNSLAGK